MSLFLTACDTMPVADPEPIDASEIDAGLADAGMDTAVVVFDALTVPMLDGGRALPREGETCFGNVDDYPGCDPERCASQLYFEAYDSAVPHQVSCSAGDAGCFAGSTLDRVYRYTTSNGVSSLTLTFDPSIDTAVTVEDARNALRNSTVLLDLGVPNTSVDTEKNPLSFGSSHAWINAFADGHISVLVEQLVVGLMGESTCPSDAACPSIHCHWANLQHGGNGDFISLTINATFTLPAPQQP